MAEQFVSSTRLAELTQQLIAGNPMSPIYIAPEDSLRITVLNTNATATYAFVGRLLRPDGMTIPIQQELAKWTNGNTAVTIITLTEGYLLSGCVVPLSGQPVRGECFALISLIRGDKSSTPPFAVLSTGYVSELQPLAWPWGSRNEGPLDNPVVPQVITASGASGGQVDFTVPMNRAWLIKSLAFPFNTGAGVGDRFIEVLFMAPPNILFAADCAVAQAATTAHFYSVGVGVDASDPTGVTNHVMVIPGNMLMSPGWTISVKAIGVLAGDLIGPVVLTVESYQYWTVIV